MNGTKLAPAEQRVLSLMSDGAARSTREIVIKAGVSDSGRVIRRMIGYGYNFVYEWVTNEYGNSYKLWSLC